MASMDRESELDLSDPMGRDDAYLDARGPVRAFDASLLKAPLTLVPNRPPLALGPDRSVKDGMQAMRQHHRGCILITQDGTLQSPLVGIFTERDVLLRVIDCGRNPANVPLRDVMTAEPETLPFDARIAWAIHMMAVGGFRHIPVTDARGWPTAVVAVRDIVEFLVESFPAEILNLPPDFGRRKGFARDGA